jgi:hypothetical protein
VLHVKMLERRGVGGQVDPMSFLKILSLIMLIGKATQVHFENKHAFIKCNMSKRLFSILNSFGLLYIYYVLHC